MNLNAPELMEPLFRFLDGLIADYGDYLYLALVYVSIPLLGWILSGGLRRKLYRGKPAPPITIGVYIPIGRPPPCPPPLPPPCIGDDTDPFGDGDGDSFAA